MSSNLQETNNAPRKPIVNQGMIERCPSLGTKRARHHEQLQTAVKPIL